jgi:serine/threonine protein kinase
MPETNPNSTRSADGSKQSAPLAGSDAPVSLDKVPATDGTPTVISRSLPQPGSTATNFHEPLRGKKLAHFELLEAAGVGGMAAVLKARDLQLERFVALKILPPEMAKDPENIDRFHQEARAAARLDHENIARVFYCGEDQSLHFIAFEYVEGENLRAILDRRGQLPVKEAVHYMLQVATGLAHAASRGVVHRDIKPSNIIITPTGRAKLVDMGLARSQEQPLEKGLTHSGITLGTFDYISPEQAEEPRNADVRSDIYSLGCTFYHVLTGQPPVPEGTAAKKLKHHQIVPPVDPRQLNPDVPDDVTSILARMMAKDPKDRYQRAEHLVQHLIQVAQSLGATAALPEGPLYVDAPLPNPPRSRPVLMAVIAGVALVAIVVLIGQLSRTALPADDHPDLHIAASKPRGNGSSLHDPEQASGSSSASREVRGESSPGKKVLVYDKEATAAGIAAFLHEAKADDDAVVTLNGNLELNEAAVEGRPLLAFRGRKLTLQAKDPAHPVTVHLTDAGPLPPAKKWLAALETECDEVVLKGIRFVVENEMPEPAFVSLLLRNCRNCRVEQCEFVQVQSGAVAGKQRSAAIVVEGRKDGPAAVLSLQYCCFLAAQSYQTVLGLDEATLGNLDQCTVDAVLALTPCTIEANQCAFGPHNALFHADGIVGQGLKLECTNCSAILCRDASVFALESGVPARLTLKHSLLARAGSSDTAEGSLVRQADDPGTVDFSVEDNCCYQVNRYWDGARENSVAEERLLQGSFKLKDSPWKSDVSLKSLEHRKLRDLFELNTGRADLRQMPGRDRLVGVDRLPGFTSYNVGLVPFEGKKTETSRTRLVDPSLEETGDGKYKSLTTAIREARRGDQILIHHNGPFREKPIDVDRADLDGITIRPDDHCQPVLMLQDDDPGNPEPALFRIIKGKVQFEQIEFMLQPQVAEESRSQTLFALFPGGQVTCKNCVITLDRTQRSGSALAVARLDNPGKDARTDHRASLSLDRCLVRADGDFLKAHGDQPTQLALVLTNSLIAVGDHLLDIDNVAAQEMSRTSLHLEMSQVTAYLGGNLLRLQAEKAVRSTIPLNADPVTNCLFVPLRSTPSPLIYLDYVEPLSEGNNKLFAWGPGHNAYLSFGRMLDEKMQDGMPMLFYEQNKWKDLYELNTGSKFSAMKPPIPEMPPSQVPASDFKRPEEYKDFGVDPAVLPRPWTGAKLKPE